MKIIVSSKHLADQLSKIDFNNNNDFIISNNDDNLYIDTGSSIIEIGCHICFTTPNIITENINWAHVRNLVIKIEEQPIELEIMGNTIKIIITY